MTLKEHEKLVPPGRAQRRPLLAVEVERIKIAPDGVHIEFHDGTVKVFMAKNLKFELPDGRTVDADTLLKQYSIEGYVAT